MMRESFQKHEELIKTTKQAKNEVEEIKATKKEVEKKILELERGNEKTL